MTARRRPAYGYCFGPKSFQRKAKALGVMYGVIAPTPEDPEPDLSDIPEADEAWFKRARLVLPCSRTRVECDETVCIGCGLRWDTGEDRPPCPR